jgi:elongation factor G
VTLVGSAAQLAPPLQAAVRTALTDASTAGGPHGYPVVDVTARVEHVEVGTAPDPQAAILAALTVAWRHALQNAGGVLLEPVMRLDVRVPPDGLGAVMRDLGARRAEVHETELSGPSNLVRALAPLAELFGYSTDLRSLTQGRGSFSMEPYDYQPVAAEVAARQDAFL